MLKCENKIMCVSIVTCSWVAHIVYLYFVTSEFFLLSRVETSYYTVITLHYNNAHGKDRHTVLNSCFSYELQRKLKQKFSIQSYYIFSYILNCLLVFCLGGIFVFCFHCLVTLLCKVKNVNQHCGNSGPLLILPFSGASWT